MGEFNYQKAYCVLAVPAFKALPPNVKKAHAKLAALVGDLAQGRDLNIPLSEEARAIFAPLSTEEIARLSRASYFVGHWHPGTLPLLFNNARGESWKVSNCADQILRDRLAPLMRHNLQIHEGKLRVTFSNRDCWLWEEFGLATPENIEAFTSCGLPFGELTLHESANALAAQIGDLWGDVDRAPENPLYRSFVKKEAAREKMQIEKDYKRGLDELERKRADLEKERLFRLAAARSGILSQQSNLIYYGHTKTFCFGWSEELTPAEAADLREKLGPLCDSYKVEFKTRA